MQDQKTKGAPVHAKQAAHMPRHARLFELIRQQNLGTDHRRRPAGDALADAVAISLRDAARQSLRATI